MNNYLINCLREREEPPSVIAKPSRAKNLLVGQTVYRTFPRLFILSGSFCASILFGLVDYWIWNSSNHDLSVTAITFFIISLILSIVAFYYFITIKILKLIDDGLCISYFFLPIKKTFSLSEVKYLSQKEKEVKFTTRQNTTSSYLDVKTTIVFNNRKDIVLSTIGQTDYQEIQKGLYKLKAGGDYTAPKNYFFSYLLDDLIGVIWTIFFFAIIIGLSHELFTLYPLTSIESWYLFKH